MSLQIQLKKSAVSQKQPFASDLAVGELALNYNADGPFLTCKDTAGNVRKLNNVWVAATAPTGPSAGDLWLDTSSATPVLKVYKDSTTTWVGATSVPLATTTVFGTVSLASAADITNGTAGKVVDAAQLQSRITDLLSNDITLNGDLDIFGDLTVTGTTTTIDTQTLIVEDKNIEMGAVSTPSDTTADGGGLTLKGATDKTFNWVNATDSWTSSENVDLAAGKDYKIAGSTVLAATTLGSSVVTSNLATVGTITSGTWSATTIATNKGGTGQTSYTDGQLLIGKTDGTLAKATITPGNGIDVTNADGSITVDVDLKANGGLVIESTELAVDLGASGITGTLAATDGGTGQTSYTDGQLLIGKTDGTLAKATLTASTGITITNGDGTITIAASGGGTVTSVTATSPLASTGGTTPDISIQDGTTTQKGAVQLEDSTSSTSTTKAATPNSVKTAYDLADAALPKAGGTMTGNLTFAAGQPTATTSSPNIVQLTDSTSSTSTTTAATPNAVKSAYDLANAALPASGGTVTGDVTLNAQSDLRFADSDSSNWVALQAPATVSSNVTWTLPDADGTSGQFLQTNGTGTLTWAAATSAPTATTNITHLTTGTSATYTPTSGTRAVYVEVIGAGGGGGGVNGQGTGTNAEGVSGGGGGYAASLITNLSQTFTYTVGAGGSGGAAGNNDGATGGTSSFTGSTTGTLTATGGSGGTGDTGSSTFPRSSTGVAGGTGSGGTVNYSGSWSSLWVLASLGNRGRSTSGSAPTIGGGSALSGVGTGTAGSNYGEGGTGASVGTTAGSNDFAGGDGAAGVIRITEFF